LEVQKGSPNSKIAATDGRSASDILADLGRNQELSNVPAIVTILQTCWGLFVGYLAFVLLATVIVQKLLGSFWAIGAAVFLAAAYFPLCAGIFRILFPGNMIQRAFVSTGLAISTLLFTAGYTGASGVLKVYLKGAAAGPSSDSSANADGGGASELKWGEPDYGTMIIGCFVLCITLGGAHLLRNDTTKTS
jgi:hypothetical protein